jgi:hypothetical protein
LAPKTNVEHWILLNNITADWRGNGNNTYCFDIFHLTVNKLSGSGDEFIDCQVLAVN